MSDVFWLDERQFARLAQHLPRDTRGKPRVDGLRVISGIVHVLKSGGRWVDAPAVYGPRKTLHDVHVGQHRFAGRCRDTQALSRPRPHKVRDSQDIADIQ